MAVVLRKFAATGQSTKAFGFLLFKLGSDEGYASWRSQRLMSESPKVLGSRAEAAYAGYLYSTLLLLIMNWFGIYISTVFLVWLFVSCTHFLTPESLDDNVIDSSWFARWHNGGGIYHKSATVDPTAIIDIGAVVNDKAVLGANVHLLSGGIIGPSCFIGQSTKIGYNAVLNNCSIGDSCVIHSGVCIGQDGFGFFVDDEGNLIKKPQVGWRDTVIGDHCKIDNLVQIGHNVVIGKGCMLCGQVGIAGSATLGDYVVLGGRVAVRDHVSIASKVRLAGNSCVTKDITESGDYGGFPAVPIKQWLKQVAILRRTSKDVS